MALPVKLRTKDFYTHLLYPEDSCTIKQLIEALVQNDVKKAIDLLSTRRFNDHIDDTIRDNKPGWGLLHYSVYNNHVSLCQQLIVQGANVNKQDGTGSTPLHDAVRRCHFKCIKLLCKNGANTNMKTNMEETALDIARTLSDRHKIKADICNYLRNKQSQRLGNSNESLQITQSQRLGNSNESLQITQLQRLGNSNESLQITQLQRLGNSNESLQITQSQRLGNSNESLQITQSQRLGNSNESLQITQSQRLGDSNESLHGNTSPVQLKNHIQNCSGYIRSMESMVERNTEQLHILETSCQILAITCQEHEDLNERLQRLEDLNIQQIKNHEYQIQQIKDLREELHSVHSGCIRTQPTIPMLSIETEKLMCDRVQSNYILLSESILAEEHMNFMFQDKFIKICDIQEINHIASQKKKVEHLLLTLLECPNKKWVYTFKKSLQINENTKHLVAKLWDGLLINPECSANNT